MYIVSCLVSNLCSFLGQARLKRSFTDPWLSSLWYKRLFCISLPFVNRRSFHMLCITSKAFWRLLSEKESRLTVYFSVPLLLIANDIDRVQICSPRYAPLSGQSEMLNHIEKSGNNVACIWAWSAHKKFNDLPFYNSLKINLQSSIELPWYKVTRI